MIGCSISKFLTLALIILKLSIFAVPLPSILVLILRLLALLIAPVPISIFPPPVLTAPPDVSTSPPPVSKAPLATAIVAEPKSMVVPSSVMLELPTVEVLVNLTIVLLVPLTDTAVP